MQQALIDNNNIQQRISENYKEKQIKEQEQIVAPGGPTTYKVGWFVVLFF